METIFAFSLSGFFVCAVFTLFFVILDKESLACFSGCAMCILTVLIGFSLFLMAKSSSTTTYYLEAEKYAQNDSDVIFTTEQGFYKWSTEDEMPESCYLLTMDDNGTGDTTDDEIIVVWEAK